MKKQAESVLDPGKPSWAWATAATLAGMIAVSAISSAILHQRQADRPVGEGELFLQEGAVARALVEEMLGGGTGVDDTVRHLRNVLTIEAVGVVDAEGRFLSATSDNLVGAQIENGLLVFGLNSGRLAAVAAPLTEPISIDGVVEWTPGDVLYQVLQPLGEGEGAVVLHYDVSELLERRAREQGIRPETLQLLGIGAFFIVVASITLIGRAQTFRHYWEVEMESEFLRRQSAELKQHNRELGAARAKAERALAFAEEKNRVRAEFVLMINHELRTPLTSVVTGAELIRSAGELSPEERQQILDDMVTDGNRLQEMISQMLAVARIENRGLNYTLRDVPVPEVCREIEDKHHRLVTRYEVSPDVSPETVYVWTDPSTLSQLVASLTDNAFTHGATDVELVYTNDLPFTPMLEIGDRPDHAVFFLIRDNGPGFDAHFLPRAFEKFEKHSFSSGTGLGLYVARMMIEAIGASLAVDTSPGGTTMAVAVPLAESIQLAEASR